MGSNPKTVLVVDDHPTNIEILFNTLRNKGYKVLVANDGESAIEQTSYSLPDIILLDVMMPGLNGFETCKIFKENETTKNIPIIFMTALDSVEDKVKGFNSGGIDYITKPFQSEEVLLRIENHITLRELKEDLEIQVNSRTEELSIALNDVELLKEKLEEENNYLKSEFKKELTESNIIGESKNISDIKKIIKQVSKIDTTVLLLGETGTGKEVFANEIYKNSNRKDKPFVKVNCAALPANLIESELFGHEKGSFTGAINRKIGRFEIAESGTIFLDEIGDLPLDLQVKLLRVLQENEIERLGSTETIKINVRIIAATNRNLIDMINKGTFREDLYYRLNVFPITLPPLRERGNDIIVLSEFIINKICKKQNRELIKLNEKDKLILLNYNWPGNVRELENVLERGIIISENSFLNLKNDTLNKRILKENYNSKRLKDIEKHHIIQILNSSQWIIEGSNGAARLLELKPSTLRSKMKRLGIQRPN